MQTNKVKVLNNIDEILEYLYIMDCFHDFRLSRIQSGNNEITITIEENTKNNRSKGARIWNFSFSGISEFKIDVDFIMPSYINKAEIIDSCFIISLDNGSISFATASVSLSIPF